VVSDWRARPEPNSEDLDETLRYSFATSGQNALGRDQMRRSLFVSLLAAAGLAGPASAADQNVAIAFGLTAAGKPAGCGGMLDDVGAAHLKAGLHDARIYVHDVKLIAAGGGRVPVRLDASEWQSAGVALLDFKDARGGRAPCSVEVPAKNTAVLYRHRVHRRGARRGRDQRRQGVA
jgi:hypothetical protein